MRAWAAMLGGLIVWAIHFFALYAAGSVFPETATARLITGAVTLACLAAAAAILVRALRLAPGLQRTLALAGALLSAIAIIWQGLPALFGA